MHYARLRNDPTRDTAAAVRHAARDPVRLDYSHLENSYFTCIVFRIRIDCDSKQQTEGVNKPESSFCGYREIKSFGQKYSLGYRTLFTPIIQKFPSWVKNVLVNFRLTSNNKPK